MLVIVHGSGSQGRGDSFYRFWGDFFARHGVAALIYDKRGVGLSTGNYEQATFDDLAGDVLSAVELLGKRKDIKHQQIGLFGISQGGWIAQPAARTDARDFGSNGVSPRRYEAIGPLGLSLSYGLLASLYLLGIPTGKLAAHYDRLCGRPKVK